MEAQFKKLLTHARADVKILSNISGGVSKQKTLGGSTHRRKRIGGGGGGHRQRHDSGWWSPPTKYKGRALGQNQNVHDLYHEELKKWKGNPEDFQSEFEHRLSGG